MIEALPFDQAQALAERLGFDPMGKGPFSIAAHPEQWERCDCGGAVCSTQPCYFFTSARTGEVYTVTADTCTCPAYALPVAAGDDPRLCYHRIGVAILDQAHRDAAFLRYQATMDAGALPADLPRLISPL
ncbi:hypothetical protein SE17_12260 [Kouleothrix aurantiaca]|uniref:SWIM-type domain-containing protein n=1 Tax=Kouleothrix aurantiaca TaxID=186479 RepID=A0A0P9DS08_9CHLR|nr:hypothetical protein SE17_12260 [Kouleothrix aurantiaca]